MRRILLLLTLAVGLLAADAIAQPPGGGGGGMGGGRGMGNRPSGKTRFMWMSFCFELAPTDAQVAKAWPLFRDTFAKQRALEDKYQDDPPEEAKSEMQKVQADLETKVKALLTPEQQKKLADLEAQQQQWRERRGSGGPGGGGPPR